MNRFSKPVPWIQRGLLTFATVAYALLGTKYLFHPVTASAADGISLGSPAAITDMRVVGALFLACGIVTLFSLLSNRRHLDGLRFVLIVLGVVTLARVYGFLADGTAPATVLKLRNEVILLTVFSAGVLFELYRQRAENIPDGKGRPRAFSAVQGESHEIASH